MGDSGLKEGQVRLDAAGALAAGPAGHLVCVCVLVIVAMHLACSRLIVHVYMLESLCR